MKHSFTMIAAMICLVPTAHAQTSRAGLSPMRLDVAGIRLAMPIAQARAALAGSSYVCRPYGEAADFAARVAKEVRVRTGARGGAPYTTGTAQLQCTGPNGEGLTVDFAQVETGSIVHGYAFRIEGTKVDLPALRRQLTAKYGRPMVGDLVLGAWCDAGYRCGDSIVFTEGPTVIVNTYSAVSLRAVRGGRADRADDAAVVAAADRIAPKKTQAAC